jgi:hypothetical protein
MMRPMKAQIVALGLSGFAMIAVAAEETVVQPKIESVGLFKNGLAVVRAVFPVSGPGVYRWDKVPRVIHGSFWIESDGEVSVRSTRRMVEETDASGAPTGNIQQDLAGREVTITLKSTGVTPLPVLGGRVWDIPARAAVRTWDTNYSSLNPADSSWRWRTVMPVNHQAMPANVAGFLVLEDAAGNRRYVGQSEIAAIEAQGPFDPVKRTVERPVLVFDVRKAPADGGQVRVTWLTKGLAWMPAYQIDLTNPRKLAIRQSAVVRNESDDLTDTEIQLISGFPNVRFGAVDSPLWPGTELSAFFQQVNQASSSSPFAGNTVGQQLIYQNAMSPEFSRLLPELAEAGNASDDIHHESIGRHSLLAGDSLSIDVAAASAEYERVVEWMVPDGRDEYGRHRQDDRNVVEDPAWDAVRFTNPFKFPMTTAAALVTEGGNFRGQSQSGWVNPGQRASVRITRALSVQTESGEVEEEGERENVSIAGRDYRRTTVKGRLVARNFRGKDVTLAIRCGFSGKLLEAEGDPEATLRTEGVGSVNPRRQLDWTIQLPAGREKEITYRYEVLVRR